jgi:hypothetical protein
VEVDKCDSDHRIVYLTITTDKVVTSIIRNNIKFRPHIRDKKKWEEFTKTLPPPPTITNLANVDNENFASTIIDHFNKTFSEKEIPKSN